MTTFIVVETADVEIVGLTVFAEYVQAVRCFEKLCEENTATEESVMAEELAGTIRLAGDDVYAVQLVQRDIA